MTDPAPPIIMDTPETPPAPRLLLVEDDPALAGYLADYLTSQGYTVRRAGTRAEAESLIDSWQPERILLDLGLPPQPSMLREGLAVLAHCQQQAFAAKVIVITGQDEEAAALEAVRCGAFDFLLKPVSLAAISEALRRANLFARQEARLAAAGETRLTVTAHCGESPREAAAAAEEQLLRRTLQETAHNIAETARRLGIAREHVYYYLKKYGIRRPE